MLNAILNLKSNGFQTFKFWNYKQKNRREKNLLINTHSPLNFLLHLFGEDEAGANQFPYQNPLSLQVFWLLWWLYHPNKIKKNFKKSFSISYLYIINVTSWIFTKLKISAFIGEKWSMYVFVHACVHELVYMPTCMHLWVRQRKCKCERELSKKYTRFKKLFIVYE